MLAGRDERRRQRDVDHLDDRGVVQKLRRSGGHERLILQGSWDARLPRVEPDPDAGQRRRRALEATVSVRDDPRDRPVDVEVVGRFLVGSGVRPDHARDGRVVRPDPATVELDRSLACRQEGESGPRDDDGRNAGCLTHLSFSSHSQEQAGCRAASPAKTPSIRASARTRGRNVRLTVNGRSGC